MFRFILCFKILFEQSFLYKSTSIEITKSIVSNLKSLTKKSNLEDLIQGMNGVVDTVANSLIVRKNIERI